ncbi:hypothetical protein GJ496_004686 [Pomphorhynchus laevis]|nr:hypothetical protein GJ496_004686 [Pomphorhynchus laevis]
MSENEDKQILLKEICQQMEFYLSDSNLSKDRYIMNCLDKSDYSISFKNLKQFNKLMNMCNGSFELVAEAVRQSDQLHLCEPENNYKDNIEKYKVKRNTPFVPISKNKMDKRTIYIECTDSYQNSELLTHSAISQYFLQFGNVAYVSIPKFQTSKDPKGFAFVEFSSKSSAFEACKKLKSNCVRCIFANNGCKQLIAIRKRAKYLGMSLYSNAAKLQLADSNLIGFVEPYTAISKSEWQKLRTEFFKNQRNELDQLRRIIEVADNLDPLKEMLFQFKLWNKSAKDVQPDKRKSEIVDKLKSLTGHENIIDLECSYSFCVKIVNVNRSEELSRLISELNGYEIGNQIETSKEINDERCSRSESYKNKKIMFSDSDEDLEL